MAYPLPTIYGVEVFVPGTNGKVLGRTQVLASRPSVAVTKGIEAVKAREAHLGNTIAPQVQVMGRVLGVVTPEVGTTAAVR